MRVGEAVRVGLVATVYNEADSVAAFLKGIEDNLDGADHVVLVDGGSTDGTWDCLKAWAASRPSVDVVSAPGAGIAAGRNIAIRNCMADLIAVTDAGCAVPVGWLDAIVNPLRLDAGVSLVKGGYRGEGISYIGRAVSRALVNSERSLSSARALPSSRAVAFRRTHWEAIQGYPEHLATAEDTVFSQNVARLGAVTYVAEPAVTWRVRETLPGVFRQYFAYSGGDRAAGTNRWLLGRITVSWTIVLLLLASRRRVLSGVALTSYTLRRSGRDILEEPKLLPGVVITLIVSDIARIAGYVAPGLRR